MSFSCPFLLNSSDHQHLHRPPPPIGSNSLGIPHHPQQQQQQHRMESVFEPNQQINLNELPSDERDIESFKRFNYFFEPPKSKLKVNLNVQDIYRSQDSPSNVPMTTGTGTSNSSPHPWGEQ